MSETSVTVLVFFQAVSFFSDWVNILATGGVHSTHPVNYVAGME
jgi:hypothetical protein